MRYEAPPLVVSPDQPMGGADSMYGIASIWALSASSSFIAPIPVVGLGTQPPEVAFNKLTVSDTRPDFQSAHDEHKVMFEYRDDQLLTDKYFPTEFE